jgi:hypothetical protein
MIDFWELTGRLLLMPQADRDAIYAALPVDEEDGCILKGCREKPALEFKLDRHYDVLRGILHKRYADAPLSEEQIPPIAPKLVLKSPVISMFALGEILVVFFTREFRTVFDIVSNYLVSQSVLKDRTDRDSDSELYIVLALLVIDSTTRASVATGEFLGLLPPKPADAAALRALANEKTFVKMADHLCFDSDWTDGSCNTLRPQEYRGGKIKFRHFRFVKCLD